MAHGIEFIHNNASIAIAAGKPAWHGLGTEITGCETASELWAVANGSWRPWEERLYTHDGQALNKKVIRKAFGDIVGKVIGEVNLSYTTYAHIDHTETIERIVRERFGTWDCAALLHGGSVYFATINLSSFEIGPNDTYQGYLTISGSYDGTHAARIGIACTRTVCANTLAVSSRELNQVARHKGNVAQKMQDAANLYRAAFDTLEGVRAKLDLLRGLKMSDEKFRALVKKVYKPQVQVKKVAPVESSGSALLDDILAQGVRGPGSLVNELLTAQETDQRNRSVDILTEIYHDAPGAVPGTAYGALQAFTYFETHGRGRSGEKRVENSLLAGNGESMIDLVLQAAGVAS